MEEKLNQIEELLKEVISKFEYRLRIKHASAEHFHNELRQLEKDYLEAHPDKVDNLDIVFDNLLKGFNANKADTSFFDKYIPQLKSSLRDALNALEERSYAEGDLIANEEFKSLIQTGILTVSTPISSKFKGKIFSGHLTEEGFFEITINDKRISFSNFRTAAERAWEKTMPNDCWNVWTVTDRSGKNYSMKHYRQLLRER